MRRRRPASERSSIWRPVHLGIDETGARGARDAGRAEPARSAASRASGKSVSAEPDRRARRAVDRLPARPGRRQAGRAGPVAGLRGRVRRPEHRRRASTILRRLQSMMDSRYDVLLDAGRRKITADDRRAGRRGRLRRAGLLLRHRRGPQAAEGVRRPSSATSSPAAGRPASSSSRRRSGRRRTSSRPRCGTCSATGWRSAAPPTPAPTSSSGTAGPNEGYTATDIDPAARGVGWLIAEGGIPRRIKTAYLDDDQVLASSPQRGREAAGATPRADRAVLDDGRHGDGRRERLRPAARGATRGRCGGASAPAMTARSTRGWSARSWTGPAGPDFDRWADQVERCGHCARPVRLRGRVVQRPRRRRRYSTDGEPDRVLLSPLRQPARVGVPVLLVRVRGRHVAAALRRSGRRPEGRPGVRPGAPAGLRHPDRARLRRRSTGPGPAGAPRRCRPPRGRAGGLRARPADLVQPRSTTEDDPRLGEPLCADCYDYAGHVAFNWWAPELWRRFTITLRRILARRAGLTPAEFGRRCRLSFVKVAEFQRRGRRPLPRADPPRRTRRLHSAPLVGLDAVELADAIRDAAAAVRLTIELPDGDRPQLGFGDRPTPSRSTATRPAS